LTPILKREVAKHFEGDIDRLVGDLSFPEKKNAHNYFEEELGWGTDPQELIRKYGWLKGRDPFVEPYTIAELERMRNNLDAEEKQTMRDDVQVPKALKSLISEARELVYFRTLRTDVFYELLYVARPLLEEVAAKYGLSYHDLTNYSVYDLLNGQLVKYPNGLTCAYFKDDAAYFAEPILPEEKVAHDEIKGVVVYRGKVTGAAKVVLKIEDLDKVKDGDILITPMTTPAYITAMKKAVAFVTNEGGITCHAAIIAREMQKPCIVGTKIATKVLKDGDLVEVDAEKGIVKILKLA
jgi:phosphohistidine swiveling domain-containing protein